MHAAVEVPDPARSERAARTAPGPPSARGRKSEAWLWLTGLVLVVSLSLADGIVGNIVAYERDTTVFYFPLMSWLSQQLQRGQFPLWTPQFFGGYPIFADGEIGLAYPPVLLALLALPVERAFVVLRLAHLLLAAVGMFAFARTWRLPYPSAVLAGLVFTLGSFLQAQIHHENIIRTASWLPLILACVERGLRSDNARSRLRWTALAALATGMAGLSLHSQMLAIDLLVLAAYGAFRWAIGPLGNGSVAIRVGRRWLARFVAVAGVCLPVLILGLGMAAVQVLPLLELASFSARGNGIPYSQAAAYSVTTFGLIQTVFPYFFRSTGNLQWGLWTHWESYLYVGLAPLVLAVLALFAVRRREIVGWAVIGGLGLVFALGQYSPINLHYYLWLLPGMSGLRAPGRFTFVVVLAAAMLAAYGLAWLMTEAPLWPRRFRRVLTGWSIAVVALALALIGLHMAVSFWPDAAESAVKSAYLSLPRDSYQLTESQVVSGLLWSTDLRNPHLLGGLGGLAVVLIAVWLWQRRPSAIWPAFLIGFTAVDLLLFGWAIHPREPLSKLGAEPPAVQALEQLPSNDAAPNRVLASPVLNQVAADRLAPFGSLQEANGYSSLQFIWHRDYLGRVLYADDGLLDLWGVRYILDPATFGTLASYKGVQYLPQQALLHAPKNSVLGEQQFALNPDVPISELRFVTALQGAVDIPQGAPVAEVELRDQNGKVVGAAELQAGRDAMDWAANVPSVEPSMKHSTVEVAGQATEDVGPEPRTRQLAFAAFTFSSAVNASSMIVRATPPVGEFVLYGGAAMSPDGTIQQLFGKTKTKYRQVYADSEIHVLENTAAFPRAFVVPTAHVSPSLGSALNQMVHQPFAPDREVILADDVNTQSAGLATDRGGHGTAHVTSYSPDDVWVHTSTTGEAWLVLTDTYYPGWTASVDGQPAPLLRGDVLFRVVPIPGGEHDVHLQFEPVSVKAGAIISGVSLVLIAALLLLAGRSLRLRRTT